MRSSVTNISSMISAATDSADLKPLSIAVLSSSRRKGLIMNLKLFFASLTYVANPGAMDLSTLLEKNPTMQRTLISGREAGNQNLLREGVSRQHIERPHSLERFISSKPEMGCCSSHRRRLCPRVGGVSTHGVKRGGVGGAVRSRRGSSTASRCPSASCDVERRPPFAVVAVIG